MLLLVGIWVYFMVFLRRKSGASTDYIQETRQHQKKVEEQLDRVISLLEQANQRGAEDRVRD